MQATDRWGRGALGRDGLWRRAWPFLAVLAGGLLLSLPQVDHAPPLLAGAAALATAVAIAVLAPWERLPAAAQAVPPLLVLVGLESVRLAHDSLSPGLAPLVLVPLAWCALYGGVVETAIVYAAAPVVVAQPYLDDPGRDSASELVRAGVYVLVGGLLVVLLRRSRESATLDALTGLTNRQAGDERLTIEMERARRLGVPLSVAMLDVDLFKHYNDAYGHLAGDALLRRLGALLREGLRRGDVAIRWGGEEFLVASAGVAPHDLTAALARVRRGMPAGTSFSAGVARWDGTEDLDALLARVDDALYAAKDAGRDRVVPLTPHAGARPHAAMTWSQAGGFGVETA